MKLEDIKSRTKDAVDYLVQSLESGHSEVLSQYLGAMARFHTYSFGNVMLIASQKPDATNVAGLRTWNSLGRFVKRGEKSIFILAPMVGYRRSRQNEIATDIDTHNTADERKPEQQLVGFRAVYVFDISQTEGKEPPALTDVQGNVSGYRERLFEFVQSQGVELNYSERIAPAKGLPRSRNHPRNPPLAVSSRTLPHSALRQWRSLRQPRTPRSEFNQPPSNEIENTS
jgi:hypothetical protein